MEIKKATIRRDTENTYLIFNLGDKPLELNLTEDNPNNVKSIFNQLLKELKKGKLNFEIEDEKNDLFFNICSEYVDQLNHELNAIYEELDEYELLEE